jgi:hypothetical protein
VIDSIATAGAALIPIYEGILPNNEPAPDGEHACVSASHVAKAAEWAAEAAQASPSASANAALEAYTWARDASHAAEAVDILGRQQSDFAGLFRVAARGRWTDETPVPASLFDLLAEDPPEKPWWVIWR